MILPFGVRKAPLIYKSSINIDGIKCEIIIDPENDGVHDIAPWKQKSVKKNKK